MKSIYQYDNYRDFLRDYYTEMKETSKGFSFSQFSHLSGLGSANYIKFIIEGKRNLTVETIHGTSVALRLIGKEIEYYEALVLANQATPGSVQGYYLTRLKRLRGEVSDRIGRSKSPTILKRTENLVLLMALSGRSLHADPIDLCQMTGLRENEIKASILQMIEERLVRVRGEKYELVQDHWVFNDPKSRNEVIRKYLERQLELSRIAFRDQYTTGAKFFAHTFTVKKENFARVTEEIQSLLDKLTRDSDESADSDVAQLNIQFFPFHARRN
jgi:uncharacterized protein (TIGR02147 family)